MPKNKVRENGLSVRLRESTWRLLENDMKQYDLTSMNQAVQRRLDESVAKESLVAVAELAAQNTALQHTRIIVDHINNLMSDLAGEMQHLRAEREHDRRAIVDLQQALIQQLAKQGA
jgi:hypothetical protein